MCIRFRPIFALLLTVLITASLAPPPVRAVPAYPDLRRTIRFAGLLGGHGEFRNIYSLNQDAANNIYVSHGNAFKVYMYDQNGQYLREFGSGQNTVNNGDLPFPWGVAASGNTLYVVDNLRNVVQLFNLTTTAPISAFTLPAGNHYGMALGPDGKLYLPNFTTNQIEIFTTAGVSAGSFGVAGAGDGQLNGPIDVAFDSLGYLYVADFGNSRIQKFNRSGVFIRKIGQGNLNGPQHLVIDRANHLWVTSSDTDSVQVYDTQGTRIGVPDSGPLAGRYGNTAAALGIAVIERSGALPDVYIYRNTEEIIQRFQPTTIPLAHTFQQTVAGSSPGQMALDSAQNLYVADNTNNRISVFDKYGSFLRNIGSGGTGMDKLASPFSIAVAANGEVYVASPNRPTLIFDANGTFRRRLTDKVSYGIALDDRDRVYETLGSTTGYVRNRFGKVLQQITLGPQFIIIRAIAVDPERELIYFVDQGTNQGIRVYDIDGTALGIFPNSGDCTLSYAQGIALDGRGSLYLASVNNHRVIKYTQNGTCLGSFGTLGTGNGQFNAPIGAAFNTNTGALWVSDSENGRIQRFGAPNVRADRGGVYRPANKSFYLRNANSAGAPDFSFALSWAAAGDLPVAGDWNGDGVDTVGFYRPSTRQFLLNNLNASTTAPLHTIGFGVAGDLPLIGDWDGDGIDGIGVFRPSNATFYLRNVASPGNPDLTVKFGTGTDRPIVGDWDADGRDSVGVWRPSNGTFYLNNGLQTTGTAPINASFAYGLSTDIPLTGDWTEQGITSVGVWRPSNRNFLLRNTLTVGAPNTTFAFGLAGDIPVTGEWGNTFTETIPPADAAPMFAPKE